jgi:hypothetical protein
MPRASYRAATYREFAIHASTLRACSPAQGVRCGVQGAKRELGLVAIDPPATVVPVVRRQELVIVERLHDRQLLPRRDDHGRAGQLGVELVGVDDLGTEELDQALHRRRSVAIPDRAARDPELSRDPEVAARGVGHRGGDELALAEGVSRARGGEQGDLMATPAQELRQAEAVEVGAACDVGVLVNQEDAHPRTPIASGGRPSPA